MTRKLFTLFLLLCYSLAFVARDAVCAALEPVHAASFNDHSSSVPLSLGRVTALNNSGSELVVVGIQDIHCHAQVQRSIAGILAFLDKEYRLDRVFVEGASGAVDMSWLERLGEQPEGKKTIESLVEQGKLTGAEFFALQSGRQGILNGLENETLYRENFERLVNIRDRRGIYEERIRSLYGELARLKRCFLSRSHLSFETLIEKRRAGAVSDEKFYRLLKKFAGNAAFDNSGGGDDGIIGDYRALRHEVKSIRFKSAARELRGFLEEAKQRLPYEDYRELAVSCRAWADQPLFPDTLLRSAEQCRVNLDEKYPELSRFAAYLRKNSDINPLELIKEQDRLIREIRAGLSRDKVELEVSFLCDFLPLFEGYFLNRLTSDEYGRLKRLLPEFRLLWEKYAAAPLGDWEKDYALLNAFYETNIQRDTCFIETLAGENNSYAAAPPPVPAHDTRTALKGAKRIVAVVTGGFHTDGMESLLAERGITFLTITPSVTEEPRGAALFYDEIIRLQAAFKSNAYALRVLAQQNAAVRKGVLLGVEINETTGKAENGLSQLLLPLDHGLEEALTAMCREWNLRGPAEYPEVFSPVEFGGLKEAGGRRYASFIDKNTRQLLVFEITADSKAVFRGGGNIAEESGEGGIKKAALPFLREFISRHTAIDRNAWENIYAPVIEEILYTGVPLAAGALAPAWFPLIFLSARAIFVSAHLPGRNEFSAVEKTFLPVLLSAGLAAVVLTLYSFAPFTPFAVVFLAGAAGLHSAVNALLQPWINGRTGTRYQKAAAGHPGYPDTERWAPYIDRVKRIAGIEYGDADRGAKFERDAEKYVAGFLQRAFSSAEAREDDLENELDKSIALYASSLLSLCDTAGLKTRYPERIPHALVEVARMAARRESGLKDELKNIVPNLPDGFGVSCPELPGFRMKLSPLYKAPLRLSEKYMAEGITVALVLPDMKDGLADLTKMELLIEQLPRVLAQHGIDKVRFRVIGLSDDPERMRKMLDRFRGMPGVTVDSRISPLKRRRIPAGDPLLENVDLLFSMVWPVQDVVEYPGADDPFPPVCMALQDYDLPRGAKLTAPDHRTRTVEVPTGFRGLGFYVDPRVKRLRRWMESLTPEQRRQEKKLVVKALFSEITGGAFDAELTAERTAGSRWALLYLHQTAEDYIQVLRNASRSMDEKEPVTLFTFFSGYNVHDRETPIGQRAYANEFERLRSAAEAAGINDVRFYDAARDPEAISRDGYSSPGIRVVNLGVRSYPLFLKVMALSDLPVGVTGDESLLAAMILGIPFVYEYYDLKDSLFTELLKFFYAIKGGQKVAGILESFKNGAGRYGDRRELFSMGSSLFMPDPRRDAAFKTAGDAIANEGIFERLGDLSVRLLAVNDFFDRAAERQNALLAAKRARERTRDLMAYMGVVNYTSIPFSVEPREEPEREESEPNVFEYAPLLHNGTMRPLTEGDRGILEGNKYVREFSIMRNKMLIYTPVLRKAAMIFSREQRIPTQDDLSGSLWRQWQEVLMYLKTDDYGPVMGWMVTGIVGAGILDLLDEEESDKWWGRAFIETVIDVARALSRQTNLAAEYPVFAQSAVYDVYTEDPGRWIARAREAAVKRGLPRIGITYLPEDARGFTKLGQVMTLLPGTGSETRVPIYVDKFARFNDLILYIPKPEQGLVPSEDEYLGAAAAAMIDEIAGGYFRVMIERAEAGKSVGRMTDAGFRPGAVITTKEIFEGMAGARPWKSLAEAPVIINGSAFPFTGARYHPSAYHEKIYSVLPEEDLDLLDRAMLQKNVDLVARGHNVIVAMNLSSCTPKRLSQTVKMGGVLIRGISKDSRENSVVKAVIEANRAGKLRVYGGFHVDGTPGEEDLRQIAGWTYPGRGFYGAEIDFGRAEGVPAESIMAWLMALAAARPCAPFMVRIGDAAKAGELKKALAGTSPLITVETDRVLKEGLGRVESGPGETTVLIPKDCRSWRGLDSLKGTFIVELAALADGPYLEKADVMLYEHLRVLTGLIADSKGSLAEEAWGYRASDLPDAQSLEALLAFSEDPEYDKAVAGLEGPAGMALERLRNGFLHADEESKPERDALARAFARSLTERMLFEQWAAGRTFAIDPYAHDDAVKLFARALYNMKRAGASYNAVSEAGVRIPGDGAASLERALNAARRIIDLNPLLAARILEPFITPVITVTEETFRSLRMEEISSILSAA